MTASLGQLKEAERLIRKALVLEPLSGAYHFYLGWYLLAQDKLDESETAIRRAIEIQPVAEGYHLFLTSVYVKRGQGASALATAQAETNSGLRRLGLALAYSVEGHREQADAALQELIRLDGDTWPVSIAAFYAYRGEREEAFKWLDHAWDVRQPGVTTILYDPFITPGLRDDPRFAAYCRKVGLPPPPASKP